MRNGRPVYGRGGRLKKWGIPVSDLNPNTLSLVLVGAEGDGDGGGDGGDGSGGSGNNSGDASGDGGSGDGTGGDNSGSGDGNGGDGSGDLGDGGRDGGDGGGGDPDTFDRAYVEKLRKEAADNRIRAKKAEDELSEKKKAEMSDLELAQTERDQQKTRGDKLESDLDQIRLQLAVTNEASSQNFHDPQDALSLIDRDSISKSDEGEYNKQSVKAAVERLAKEKPHLIKGKFTGSGDGGARGDGSGNMTDEEKSKKLSQEFKERGGVPLPKL